MVREILEKHLQPKSDFIFGFADLNGLIDTKFDGFNYGISIGKKLDDIIINNISEGPTLEYYEYYKSVNKDLSRLTDNLETEFRVLGIESCPIEPTVTHAEEKYSDYLKTLTVDLSHKLVATRAGLGWIGKTDLFISERFGPRLRLVSILLKEKPGDTAVPVNSSKCGQCTICVEKCPAGAASGALWNISVHRNSFFDAHKCRNMCSELARTRLNADERICGLCVSVCPIGRKKSIKINYHD
jgi:epoxyqueuosine reductase